MNLLKIIVDLKNTNCGKSSYSRYWSQILPILGEITAYLRQRKKKYKHFKTISREKSRILPIFDEMTAYLLKKIAHLK